MRKSAKPNKKHKKEDWDEDSDEDYVPSEAEEIRRRSIKQPAVKDVLGVNSSLENQLPTGKHKARPYDEEYTSGDDSSDAEEEVDITQLSPNSRRKISNKKCAQRRRRRKDELIKTLAKTTFLLRAAHTTLLNNTKIMTTYLHKQRAHNCLLKVELEDMSQQQQLVQ